MVLFLIGCFTTGQKGENMQLTLRSNHAVRLLIFCALKGDENATVREIATACHASEHHMAKIANTLVHLGFLKAVRGRNGGVKLAKKADDIVLGQVVRAMEDKTPLTECFADPPTDPACPLMPLCLYRGILEDAQEAFFKVLDQYSLSAILQKRAAMASLLGIS